MTTAPEPSPTERGLGFERLVFFSDAVFAIAITLLVIDLRLPEVDAGESGHLATVLVSMAPRVAAYALSFGVIGLTWMAHWRRYGYIDRIDERLVALNLVQLGFVALMPFPTAVLSTHGDEPAAVLLYVAVIAAGGVAGTACWLHAARAGLVRAGLPQTFVRLSAVRGIAVPAVMVASLPLLLVGTGPTTLSWLAIIPVQVALNRRMHRLRAEQAITPPV